MSDYGLDPLPYEYDTLELHISEQVLTWHRDTHHQGYVDDWNTAEETFAESHEAGEFGSSAGVLRNIIHNGSGHILHDLFWQNMSPEGGDEPKGALAKRIAEGFGSCEAWRDEFEATVGVTGGWVLLVYDSFLNQLWDVIIDKHDQGALWGSHPVFALDIREHSYYHDYDPARGDPVSAFFEVVDWNEPTARHEQAVELFE